MRKTIVYQCEVCDQTYNTREYAQKCEKSHVKPMAVAGVWNQIRDVGGFPYCVCVQFEDGNIIRYRMQCVEDAKEIMRRKEAGTMP